MSSSDALPAEEITLAPAVDFASIYAAHFDGVWAFVRRMGVPTSSVGDATQDTFVVAYTRLETFDRSRAPGPWLYGIAYNVSRRYRRRQWLLFFDDPPDPPDPVSLAGVGERAEALECARVRDAILKTIPMDQRAVMVLSDLHDMTIPEVAEALSINLNTAYSRLRSAREHFANAWRRFEKGWVPR